MDILDKILKLHQDLIYSNIPNKQELKKQIDLITCKYINECQDKDSVSHIHTELSSIETQIPGNTHISPIITKDEDTKVCNKERFINEAIITKVHSLSKLPIPFSQLFDRNKFNNFVINKRNEIISKLESENHPLEYLIEIANELDQHHLLFIKDEFVDLYKSYLCYFENIKFFNKEQYTLRNIIINKIRNIDITVEELYYFKEYFDKEIDRYFVIKEKDMEILQALVKQKDIFTKVVQILGLKKEHVDTLHNFLSMKSSLLPNIDIVNNEILLMRDLIPNTLK